MIDWQRILEIFKLESDDGDFHENNSSSESDEIPGEYVDRYSADPWLRILHNDKLP